MKKTAAILLSAVILCTVTGCGDSGTNIPSAPPAQTDGLYPSPETETPGAKGGDAALPNKDAIAADTRMMTVDGDAVTWDDFYPWLLYSKVSFEQSYGEINDYSAEIGEGITYSDYILGNAAGALRFYRGIEKNAAAEGIVLTDEEREELTEIIGQGAASFESEEEYLLHLETSYGGLKHYEYMLTVSKLYNKCFAEKFGETGEKLSDEDVLEYSADDGYMMAKHILLRTVDDSNTPVSDEEKSEKRSQMESMLTKLKACPDSEAVETMFDELMNEYSEDTGLGAFPDGYLFQTGEMVEEFEKAAAALGEYEYSDIVETQFGYHIVMRLPVNLDTIPMAYQQYMQYGFPYTLRYITAENMFSDIVSGWSENLTVVTEEEYELLDLSEIFGR